jgi:ABC-type transport system involved in cytochrome bd biosynthesis fused ATPase/permease subunit
VSGNKSLADVFAQIATDKIKQATANYKDYFPFVFAIIITGLLLTFAFLLNWATQIVCWLLFKLLLAIKFFKLTKVQIEVEKLDV